MLSKMVALHDLTMTECHNKMDSALLHVSKMELLSSTYLEWDSLAVAESFQRKAKPQLAEHKVA